MKILKPDRELSNCPFCGNDAKAMCFACGILKRTKMFYVQCVVCGSRTDLKFEPQQANDAWNRRCPDEDPETRQG